MAACVAAATAACAANDACHGFALRSRSCAAGSAVRWQSYREGEGSAVPNADWTAYTTAVPPSPPSPPTPSPPPPPPPPSPNPGSTLHVSATGPGGPFVPVATKPPGCNNPSPFLHPNGTLFLACTWALYRTSGADFPRGAWHGPVPIAPASRLPGAPKPIGAWEDPFLFVDRRGHFHVLAHVYTTRPFNRSVELAVSGHAFSLDGLRWTFSPHQPYSNAVSRADGSVQHFATLERPKLLFADPADPHRPTQLLNGASPVWGHNASDPCAMCGNCCHCKVTSVSRGDEDNVDWTYTLVRPVEAGNTVSGV